MSCIRTLLTTPILDSSLRSSFRCEIHFDPAQNARPWRAHLHSHSLDDPFLVFHPVASDYIYTRLVPLHFVASVEKLNSFTPTCG